VTLINAITPISVYNANIKGTTELIVQLLIVSMTVARWHGVG